MAFFAELLDTAREQPHELRAAKTILMLAALRPEPCELATVHAINSKLLLDECDDSSFYDLIIHGRIRFRWSSYPDGTPRSPRHEFCERIGREKYFRTWPETRIPDGAGGYENRQDVCEIVRRILLGDPTSTGIPTLDARISNANELFSAIEQSDYRKQELSRRAAFVNSLRASIADIPKSEEYDDLRSIIAELASDGTIDGRSNAWAAIEARRLPSELEAQAKDVVDAVYNSSVAHSLEADLLSTRRIVPLASGFHGAANSARARIDYFDTINVDERLKPLIGRQITWEAVRAALERRSV